MTDWNNPVERATLVHEYNRLMKASVQDVTTIPRRHTMEAEAKAAGYDCVYSEVTGQWELGLVQK